ncbi:E3 ubiquitin-protein ligase RNF12-B-like isoform X2 [Salvelinus fontinalis]|uniref:E3 ubiquitin-protein ligase RNF12-B-like isoform X2 n=1 Tax=Salvelinus fontinalis TaxID=8038 RepID=UPI00248517B5|nr:E3 ubiquitin-protein ligase RNF12-B-like isoform X2 [Salvelinus fontinalis]XP_055741567.1 E3 ubiquitin-protein ligase RNF12-B-like isoform X2 [Salvelinus fontinalis]XP_055741577.1 E3 ubiquitin-protein ligase RNF12-B-like isoform X2 [Salvelinus fontinalis]
MELDASIILPALFFTILAVVLAAKFIPKKLPEGQKKRVKVGNGDDIPPSRALTPAVGVVEVPKVEMVPPQVVEAEVLTEPVTVAPVVEEINVAEEETVKEPEMILEVQAVPEPVVEPEPVPEPITEPEPIPVVVEEPILELIAEPEPVSVMKEVPVRELSPEPAREPKPAREPTPEPIFVPEPEDLESNAEVHFTPGMKISKLEKLMTKEEMEEEQRIELTPDFTSL